MSGLLQRALARVAVVLSVFLSVILLPTLWSVAIAQTVFPPRGTTTTTGSPSNSLVGLAWASIVLGAIGVAVVLYFVSRESQRTQTTVREALRRGVVVVINSFSSTSGQMVTAALDQSEDEKPRIELKDGGPIAALRIQVGQAGPELVVKRGGSPQQATWTSNPPDFIDVSADPTASLRLQAKKAGTFTLVAAVKGEVSGSDAQSDPVAVTADPPTQTQATSVPFLGQGWGSMIIAILVAALVAALGFAGILGSEAVAGFYGALIGYVFHQATAQGSQTSVGADQGSRPPGGTS